MTELSLEELEAVSGGMGRRPKSMAYEGPVFRYTFQRGDSLINLARQYGTDIQTIRALNPGIHNPKRIEDGTILLLPSIK